VLNKSEIPGLVKTRYASFDAGQGQAYEQGKLTLADLHKIAHEQGEVTPKSGKQELYESILLRHI
jgi:xylose isomerase